MEIYPNKAKKMVCVAYFYDLMTNEKSPQISLTYSLYNLYGPNTPHIYFIDSSEKSRLSTL